ncbi:MAG: radical SAM family heme chaperone HemW [Bacteroidales bacterium]|nr:radical SAM family heme chaperone HemW [Bacteroidales bacterium]
MSSLYFHIPFCHHKCIYCDFYSIAQSFDKDLYIRALINELKARKDFISPNISTVYFGGGTPSLLSAKQVGNILSEVYSLFSVESNAEISFEANPENINIEYAKELKKLGINRISLGIQSFDDRDLKLLNRSHNSETAKASIDLLRKAGFVNISADLISNLPYSTLGSWKKNLETLLAFRLPHISAYTLMREENTMLDKLLQKEKLQLLSEEEALEQMDLTCTMLENAGYIHYETSSFALMDYQSRHNINYWTFGEYLGLGAGAHSYKKNIRMWNIDDVFLYTKQIMQKDINSVCEQETLTQRDMYNEYIMLSARLKNGLNKNYIQENFPQYLNHFCSQTEILIKKGLLSSSLQPTKEGLHLQDYIILSLAD